MHIEERPKGCRECARISFISDPVLRPHPESCWLWETVNDKMCITGVATSLEKAWEQASSVFK